MISISVAHNEARLQATLDFLNLGPAASKIKIYTSPRPANGAAITTQVMLTEITLDDPPGEVAANKLTLFQIDDALILEGGDANWARVENGDGDHAMDCDCGDAASSAELKFVSVTLLEGGLARMTAAQFG